MSFLSRIITAGDVLHGSSGHKDALETDCLPTGEACLCPGRSVSTQTTTWLRNEFNVQ